MVYVGVDLHRKRSQVVVLDETGEVVTSRRLANEPENFFRVFGELEPASFEVAFEATYGWGWFADLLTDAGIPARMAHPLATKAISSARVKNDSVDAKTLAHLLRTNLLPEAWIAPAEVRELRRLVRMRASMVRIASRCKCQIHAILADHRIMPPMSDVFSVSGRRFLGEAAPALREVSRGRVQANLRLIDAVSVEVAQAEKQLRGMLGRDLRLRRLLPIPGVGFTTAATVVAEVFDVTRFPTARRLCSWAGLTPSERSSDERTRRGHITKQGSRWLRWAMVEAAAHPGSDPAMRRFHDRIARKRGNKIARVALARRILTHCYYALRDDMGCRAYPVSR